MKKLLITILVAIASAGALFAQNKFTVDDVNVSAGKEGTLTVKYCLDEGIDCSGYSFWLRLPESVEFVLASNGLPEYTLGDVYEDTPTFSEAFDDGFLKVVCITSGTESLSERSGTLVTFKVKLKGDAVIGNEGVKGWLMKGFISAENGMSYHVADVTFWLGAQNITKGDANGDGSVTITDAVAIVNYILNTPGMSFNFSAADVNGDSKITITDAVGVVNIILGQGGGASAPALTAPMLINDYFSSDDSMPFAGSTSMKYFFSKPMRLSR